MTRFVTLTMNPALDLGYALPALTPRHKIRVPGYHVDPGGGGLNVARVLHQLGAEVCAVVLLGGHAGDWLADLLRADGVDFHAVPVCAPTRISVNLHAADSGQEYRIVPDGDPIAPAEAEAALAALAAVPARWIALSGSLAPGLPDDFYARAASRRGAAHCAVDTSGRALAPLRGQEIDLLKLSLTELGTLHGGDVRDIEAAASALVKDGTARQVAVTLGEAGALLAGREGVVRAASVPVEVRSTVGAGDAFLAALVLALDEERRPEAALRYAVAVSAAAVASEGTARLRADLLPPAPPPAG
jgi:6-phosphofructokinase 2